MAMTDFTVIRRSLTARAFSTVVTILMVATAVGLMLVLLSMRDSSRRAFQRGSGNMHLLVSRDASPLESVLNGVFYANSPRQPIPWSKYEEIARSFPLEYAIPIQLGDSYRGFPVLATTAAFFEQYQPDVETPWSFKAGHELDGEPFQVVIGSETAKATGLTLGDRVYLAHGHGRTSDETGTAPAATNHVQGDVEHEAHDDDHDHDHDHDHADGADAQGDHVHEPEGAAHVHRDFPFTVVGILDPTGGPHDRALFADLESAWVIHAHDRRVRESAEVHETTAEDLRDDDRLITGIYLRVKTREGAMMSGAQQQVFDQLRRDPSVTVASPVQQIDNLFKIVANVDQIFLGLAAVVMISSGIAIMLALYNSMEQRRRQIAVLRVLGCSRRRVFGLIVTESAIIGLAGTVLGVLLAFLGAIAVAVVLKDRLGLVIEPQLPLTAIAAVAVATIALSSLAGLVPGVAAYRTAVARNLRPLG